MANLTTYLKYYKNLSFKEVPFNEVDNVFLAELSYLNWKGIVPTELNKISFKEAASQFLDREKSQDTKNSKFIQNIIGHLKDMKDGLRFKNCLLGNFAHILDDNEQFGAICIYLGDGQVYVSFQGTDDSITGWKEDFEMGYKFPTLSQADSIKYINNAITWSDTEVYLGGHSKGGNLAICAGMYCKDNIKNKIKRIYNNDGPGFEKEQFNSKEYNEILDRIITYKPEDSIVGMLLYNSSKTEIVKSKEKGIFQHDLTTWECFGTFLEKGKLSENSKKVDTRIKDWIDKYSVEDRETLVKTFFESLYKINVKTVDDFRHIEFSQLVEIINEMKNVDTDTKKLYLDAIKNLINQRGNK